MALSPLPLLFLFASLPMAASLLLHPLRRTTCARSSSRLFSIETHYSRTAPPSLVHAETLAAPTREQRAAAAASGSYEQLAPVVHHLRADRSYGSLADFVEDETGLPRRYIDELIRFGAVYLATPVEPRASSQRPQGAFLPSGRGSPGHRDAELSRAARARPEGGCVPKGSYSRVHLNPRRYPGAHEVPDWKDRIIEALDDIIFVDKPAGVPMIPTVDNNVENAYSQLCAALGVGGGAAGGIAKQFNDLHCLGRLDACTSGVCAFATSRRSSAAFHTEIAARRVSKRYRLLCSGSAAPPRAGQLVQHLFRRRAEGHEDAKPSLLGAYDERALEERDSLGFAVWQEAALRVVSSRAVDEAELDLPLLRQLLQTGGRRLDERGALYECEVELITGRTHQVRLQFSALGLPLVGDSRYAPVAGLLHGSAAAAFGPDPTSVCLQSSALAFPELQREAKAKWAPMWRKEQLL